MERMTIEQYRASVQGRTNRAQGLAFEKAVDDACLYYQMHKIANIEKTPEPMRVIQALDRRRGIFKAVFEKSAQPDYKGTLRGGRSVAFDAKHTETDRINQNTVTEKQWEALDLHEELGAWCFILVSLGMKYYRVPWERWKTMKEAYGHKYMNASELSPYEIPPYPFPLKFLETITPQQQEVTP